VPTVPIAAAAATTLVSVAFALSTLERWVDRRRPHELVWTLALAMFAGASAAQWWGASAGWGDLAFRLFYLLGPVASVPELALGTVLLLGSARTGRIARGVVHAWVLVGTGVVLAAPLTAAIEPETLPQGSDVFGPLPRVLAAAGRRSRGRRRRARWRRRRSRRRRLAVANALIALGTVVLSLGGLFNSVADEMTSFALAHALGITLVFAGFLVTNRRRRPVLAVVRRAATA
jgi:polyferredoxin